MAVVCSMRFHIEFQPPFSGFLFQLFRVIVWAKSHVGTHGSCVRSRRLKYKCTIVRTDARAVRPYMPLVNSSSYHFANPKVQCSKFNVQSQGPYMPLVNSSSYLFANPKGQRSKFNIQSQGPYMHSNGLQSQPYCAVISAILACNMGDIAR